MAEKSVSVRLSATVAPYQKAMADATTSTKKFEQESGANFQRVGANMSRLGSTMTRSVTLPLLAVGAGALKLSTDFDSSMAKITALVGIGADEVAGMKDSVLELSGATATAPQELADALFVLTSAGLRGDDALNALEASAKASAAGLGETNDIARAVAGAMNAYGPEALDAARATDILTATARAGNFETSQLAGALGRVLPFAKQAGASFEDVGGAVALLTRTNGNAAESITQVQALMRAFVVPTAEAATILGDLGMSAEDVRTSIGENGLSATLEVLDGKLGGNREQLGRLLGSSEAASAAFQILDADAATIEGTFGTVTDSVGMTDEAFETMAETGAVKMKQAWVDIQTALIEVGSVIAPIAAEVADGISRIAGAFTDLPTSVQTGIIGIGLFVAAVGPMLSIGGRIVSNLAAIRSGLMMMKAAMLGHPLLALATVAATVGAAIYMMGNQSSSAAKAIDELADSMTSASDAGDGLADWIMENAQRSALLVPLMDDAGVTISELTAAALEGGPAWESMADKLRVAGDAAGLNRAENQALGLMLAGLPEMAAGATAKMDERARVDDRAADAAGDAAVANDLLAEAQAAAAEEAEAAAEAQLEYIESILEAVSATFDYESAVLDMQDAVADYAATELEAAGILFDSTTTTEEKEAASRSLRQQEIALAEQALQTAEAYAREKGAVDGSSESAQLQIDKLTEMADEYPELREEIDTYINTLLEVPDTVTTVIDADTGEAIRKIDDVAFRLGGLNGRTATVSINTLRRSGDAPIARAGGGPVSAGHLYEVGESDVAEMFMSGGRQYMIPGNDGQVIPGSQLQRAGNDAQTVSGNQVHRSVTTSPPGSLTLIVDGHPFKAMIADHERAQIAELMAGVR